VGKKKKKKVQGEVFYLAFFSILLMLRLRGEKREVGRKGGGGIASELLFSFYSMLEKRKRGEKGACYNFLLSSVLCDALRRGGGEGKGGRGSILRRACSSLTTRSTEEEEEKGGRRGLEGAPCTPPFLFHLEQEEGRGRELSLNHFFFSCL